MLEGTPRRTYTLSNTVVRSKLPLEIPSCGRASRTGVLVVTLGPAVGMVAIVLPPGRPGFDTVTLLHFVDWSLLAAGFLALVATMVSGFCRDIDRPRE